MLVQVQTCAQLSRLLCRANILGTGILGLVSVSKWDVLRICLFATLDAPVEAGQVCLQRKHSWRRIIGSSLVAWESS